ncbi:MAG: 4'-phosphopantetheinyl transferase superfamily protein [Prevotella sp.]|nr:4'-phosphopantetheinyl transferase superfamily protein [Prevotella sp.]
MALINVREVYPNVFLGLWQTTETVDEFFGTYGFLEPYRQHVETSFKNDGRKKEFLAIHALLHEMLAICGKPHGARQSKGLQDQSKASQDQSKASQGLPVADVPMIGHAASGQPLLRGYHVGVTHTKGYAALMLSKSCDVACDIEHFSDRVERIKSKFLRKDEKADDLDSLLVHWCSKETVYKLFPEDNLQFSQMRVGPFSTMSDWACEVENMKRGEKVRVDFELTMQFVLTYAFRKRTLPRAAGGR